MSEYLTRLLAQMCTHASSTTLLLKSLFRTMRRRTKSDANWTLPHNWLLQETVKPMKAFNRSLRSRAEMRKKTSRYHYQVKVSTHQILYQTIGITSGRLLSDEQIVEWAIEKAQKGVWKQGDIDQSIDIDDISENG